MILQILSPKKMTKILAVFTKPTSLCRKTPLFWQNVWKIAENNVHDLDPRSIQGV
jgi:hypothetical protein